MGYAQVFRRIRFLRAQPSFFLFLVAPGARDRSYYENKNIGCGPAPSNSCYRNLHN